MFDPYHKWLGIPKDQRPPTYYQLLGISPGEQDVEAIEEAAIRQTTHVRAYQIGKHAEDCTRILNEISQARLTLLNPAKRKAYDQKLAKNAPPKEAASPPPENLFEQITSEPVRSLPGKKKTRVEIDEERPAVPNLRKKTGGLPSWLLPAGIGGGVGAVVLVVLVFLFGRGSTPPAKEDNPPIAENKNPVPQPPNKEVEKPPVNPVVPPPDPKPNPPVPLPPPQTPVVLGNGEGVGQWRIPDCNHFAVIPHKPHQVLLSGGQTQLLDLNTGQVVRLFDQRRGGALRAAIAITRDGKKAFIARMDDPTIRLLDLETSQELGTLIGHQGWVKYLKLTPDDKYLISIGGDDTQVGLTEVASLGGARPVQTLVPYDKGSYLRSVGISADGKQALLGDSGNVLWLLDLEKRQRLRSLSTPTMIFTAAFTPDKNQFLVSTVGGIHRGELNPFRLTDRYEVEGQNNQITFAPDGKYFLTAVHTHDQKGRILLWEWPSIKVIKEFDPKQILTKIQWGSDSTHFFSMGNDRKLQKWLVVGTPVVATKPGEPDPKSNPKVPPKPPEPPVVADKGDEVGQWQVPATCSLQLLPHKPQQILLSGLLTQLFDMSTGQVVRRFGRAKSGNLRASIALTKDGKKAFVANMNDPNIYLWDLETGQEVGRLTGHAGWVAFFALSPDGRYLLSGSGSDGNLYLTEVASLAGTQPAKQRGVIAKNHNLISLGYSTDGKKALTGDNTGHLLMWDLENRGPLKQLQTSGTIFGAAFSPDERQFLISTTAGIHRGDLNSFQITDNFTEQEQVEQFAFAPDGKHLLTISRPRGLDGRILLWEWPAMKVIKVFDTSTKNTYRVLWESDGTHFYSLGNGTLRKWRAFGPPAVAVKTPGEEKKLPGEDKKAAVPGAEAIQANLEILKEKFKKEYAAAKRSAADRLPLAEKLFQLSRDIKDDPASLYVLLAEAKDWASQAGNVVLAMQANAEIARHFAVPALASKVQTLAVLAKTTLTKENPRELVEAALGLLPEAVASDQVPLAVQAAHIAEAAAKRYLSGALQRQIGAQVKDFHDLAKEFDQMQAALASLAKDPKQTDAHVTVGKYLAFRKGDWDKGLAHLAQGGGGEFPDLARQDLGKPADAKARVELADLWWKAAAKESGWLESSLKWRAYHWYRQALPQLTGLAQGRVAERVKLVEDQPPPLRHTDTLGEIRRIKAHASAVTWLQVSGDGKRLFSGGLDNLIRTWDVSSGKMLGTVSTSMPVHYFSFSPDHKYLAVFSRKEFLVFDTRKGLPTSRDTKEEGVPGAYWRNGSSLFWVSFRSFHTRDFDKRSGSSGPVNLSNGKPMLGQARSITMAPEGGSFVALAENNVCYFDNMVFGWLPNRREVLADYPANCAAISPGSKIIAVAPKEKGIVLYDSSTLKEIKGLQTGSPVRCLVFSPNGQRLLSGGDDKIVRLWDVATGREIQRYSLHTQPVTAVIFSPDGRSAFSSSADSTVRQWSLPREMN